MTNPSCLIDLKQTLPKTLWPQVITALRQDPIIWNALQNQNFRGLAISKFGSQPQKWSPAQLAILALNRNLNFADICTQPLSEIDPELRVLAIQTYEQFANDPPDEMDLATAGLLMLALLEHYRLTHSWKNIPHDDQWKTPLSCVFGCVNQPLALLLSLPTALATHTLLSNPLDNANQAQNFMSMLVSVSREEQLSILRHLAFQHPQLSQYLAQELWKTPPQANPSNNISENMRAGLLNYFGEIQNLTTSLNNTLMQAEAQLSSGSYQLANSSLRTAWQASRQLHSQLMTQFSQTAISSGDIEQAKVDWEATNTLFPLPDENIAALAITLCEQGDSTSAQAMLDNTKDATEPLVLLAQSLIAYQSGNIKTARKTARKLYDSEHTLQFYHALILAKNLLSLKMGDEAACLVDSLQGEHPNDLEIIHLSAQAHAAVGAYPQASQSIHLATALAPDRLDLQRDYAQIHEYFGQWATALEARQAIIGSQEDPQISDLRALATCTLEVGQNKKVQEICILALKLFPDDGPIHAILGETLLKKGQNKKAEEHLQIAVQVAPEEALPWLALARFQAETNLSTAYETLRKAVLAAPDKTEIHLALGKNYLQAGSISQALTCLQRAYHLSATENSPMRSFYLKSLIALPLAKAYFELGRAEEALETVQDTPPLPGQQAPHLHLQAQTLLFLGREYEAIPLLAKARLINPNDINLALDYARALFESGKDPQKAIHTLQALLENDVENPEALALLANAFRANGNPTEALETYRQALNTRLGEDPLWYPRLSIGLAKSALELNLPEIALAALQQAWQNNPQNLDILQTLAESYVAVKLNEQALQTAILAKDLDPLSLQNLIWFTDLMLSLQAYDHAAHALNCAIELAPQQANLRLRLGEIHQSVGDFKSAHQAYRLLAELDQATPQELRVAAAELKALQYPEDAVVCLRIATQRSQDSQSEVESDLLLAELIDAYLQLEMPSEALEALDEFIEQQPDNLNLLGQRIVLLQRLERGIEALETLQDKLNEYPDSHPLHIAAAQLYYAQGDLHLALRHAQKAIDTFEVADEISTLFPVLALAADINDACLKSAEAQKILADPLVADIFPDNLAYTCLRSELALLADEEIKAAQALTNAIKVNPEHARVLALQARLTGRHGDSTHAQLTLQKALAAWGKLPKHEITSPVGMLAIADAALELNQWSTAIFMLQSAVEQFPQEPRVHLRLARGLVLRAEYQRLCETVRVRKHAPGASSVTEFSHGSFEQAILAAAQTSEATISKQLQTELAHWQLRGQAIFQPSVEHARALGDIPQNAESRAALLAALRHSQENQAGQRSTLDSFAKASHHLIKENDISVNLMVQLALALSTRSHKKATSAIDKALAISIRQRHPALAIHYAVQAYVATSAVDLATTVQALESALTLWPNEPDWHAWLAETLEQMPQPDYKASLEHLNKAIELAPQNGFYYLKLGEVQLKLQDYQAAISTLEQATNQIPDHPASWLTLASAYRFVGEYAQTFQNAERATKLDPRNIEARILLTEIALEIDNPQKALEYCQAALDIDAQHPDALLLKARVLDAIGQSSEALESFNQALKYVPKSVPLMLEHAQVTQRAAGNQRAIEVLTDLIDEYPDDPRVLAQLAEMLINNEDIDLAVQMAQKALHSNQGSLEPKQKAHLLNVLGRMMRRNGQLDHAIQYLSEAIQCDPETAEAYVELGRAYQERRQYAQALDAFHQAIAIAPGDYRAYYHAAQAFKVTKDYSAAEDMLRRAAKLAPNDLAIRRQLGGVVAINLVHNPKEGADLYVD